MDANDYVFVIEGFSPGLTKREYFAAMAMQAICTDNAERNGFDIYKHDEIAKESFLIADAMIKESKDGAS